MAGLTTESGALRQRYVVALFQSQLTCDCSMTSMRCWRHHFTGFIRAVVECGPC